MAVGSPLRLRCEYLTNPLGVDVAAPRLSWEVNDSRRGAVQTAYQVQVATTPAKLEAGDADAWDTGMVKSNQTSQVAYKGRTLTTLTTCYWRVKTWDAAGEASAWSETATWEMGLLSPEDWAGEWIGAVPTGGKPEEPASYLRKEFEIAAPVKRARLIVTARGLYEMELNGEKVGCDQLTPGWTEYRKRIPYQVYDVTGQVRQGANAVGGMLGDGWHSGFLVYKGCRSLYGQEVSLRAMLVVDYADGKRSVVATDGSWQVSKGPILSSDLYMGETYDARLEMPGWSSPGFAADGWQAASVHEPTTAELCWKRAENVQAVQELKPVTLTEPTPGAYVYDLGQNMVGVARLTVSAPAGTTIQIRFAEMLYDDGTMYTDNYRAAKSTDYYTCKGGGVEVYEPRFTFHGFRYVELTGCAEPPTIESVTGVVWHSAAPSSGSFACSHELVNKLQSNITWGQKGNFLEVPTDCPQRDERLGWTGDAQVFIRTACWNLDVAAFYTKWLRDLRDAQKPTGSVPDVIPDVTGGHGHCAWADAMIICPWTVYLCYGDLQILAEQYDAMGRWIEYMRETSDNLIRPNEGYGDWLAIDAPNPGAAPTPKDLVGTAYFAYGCTIMTKVATLLGRDADAAKFRKLGEEVKAAFNREFVTPGGRVMGHAQTGYLLALGFDLLPEALRPVALKHLVTDLERRKWHLSTGFVGTPLLAPVLSRFGRMDVAYKLLLQDTYPSWLYPILNGATTMWERWNSYTKEHGFGDVGMNSFNHYAYGAIGEWMYNSVAGIDLDPEAPGYAHVMLHPQPGGGLTWAKACLHSVHGLIASEWKLKEEGGTFAFTIPANTTATVTLPAECAEGVSEEGTPLAQVEGVSGVRVADGKVVFTAGAGSYTLSAAKVLTV